MSLAALRWAWGQPLKPSAKLVLLALVQHADRNGECWPKQAPLNTTTTTTKVETSEPKPDPLKRGGGAWIFPKGLSEQERQVATQLLERVNGQTQELLDELVGQMKDGAIRVSPMACLRGMVRKAIAGEFTSERGEKVAKARTARAESERRLREAAERKPEVAPVDPAAKARTAAFLSGLRKNRGGGHEVAHREPLVHPE